MQPMGELSRPEQVGYGTRGGAEAAVHSASLFVTQNEKDCQVLLKLDFKNAFNTVFGDKMLLEVQKCVPQYFLFVYQMYGQPSNLFYGDQILSSARGVQQGDPLGPLLFCLVTRELSKFLQSPFNCWYLDDATVGGNSDIVYHPRLGAKHVQV
ncbi:hypothetical protein RvY_02833 [Ramazzottius varieornatus]|uniref:Reverse transcriptase domain-containing protein n=1 Tax=Ramazzottius varieornatus TaxID=947166 RepID=A0A1D1UL19_RAMVA|nr:hypothetical protein RvY_02833 [Ramazzottius varieornatus]